MSGKSGNAAARSGAGPTPAAAFMMVMAFMATTAGAGECELSPDTLDRGERRAVTLCGENIRPDARLDGLTSAGIDIEYRQDLARCAVDDPRPGIYLVVKAGAEAKPATVTVTGSDAATGAAVCAPVRLSVAPRHLLPAASFHRLPDRGEWRIEIDAGAGFRFDEACDVTIGPAAGGTGLRASGRAQCDSRHARLAVAIGQWREEPVKLLVKGIAAGEPVTGVSYAPLPPPDWLDDLPADAARYVDVGGLRTRYFTAGTGDPLILVHGGQPSSTEGSAWDWQQNFAGLARRFRVFALERPGQGYTDNPRTEADYARYYDLLVDHLEGFLDALDLPWAHLVGHSQGGWPVTRFAIDHPERTGCLVDIAATVVAPSVEIGNAVRFYQYLARQVHPPAGETAGSIRRAMALFSYTGNNITTQRVDRALAISRLPKFAEGRERFEAARLNPAHPTYRALKARLLEDIDNGGLRVPTLIVWGQHDPERSVPAAMALFDRMTAGGTAVEMYLMGNAGHFPFVEYPEAFNRVVTGFCAPAGKAVRTPRGAPGDGVTGRGRH